jgi:hypothetical protein
MVWNKIEEDKMDRKSSTHRGDGVCILNFGRENLEGRDCLGKDVEGCIILK